MYVKQLILLATSGIVTDLTLVNMRMAYYTCKNTCTNIFVCDSEQSGFLNDVSIIFIDKTGPTNPL